MWRALRDADSLDPLLDAVGERRIVLLGEASHGALCPLYGAGARPAEPPETFPSGA